MNESEDYSLIPGWFDKTYEIDEVIYIAGSAISIKLRSYSPVQDFR